MAQKNPFLKYMMKDDKKEDILHTSAYAKAQSGAGMGVASTESYAVRVNINQHRRMVRNYRDSEVMQGSAAPRAKKYEPSAHGAEAKNTSSGMNNSNGISVATDRSIASAKRPSMVPMNKSSKPPITPITPVNPGISLKK